MSEPAVVEASGDALFAAGIEATRLRRYDQALTHFDEALSWAELHGEQSLWDRAFCNRCAVEIELGHRGPWLTELRRIVLRSRDLENSFLAAYNLARAYDLDKDLERATFYARLAHDRAVRLGRSDWVGWSRNQMGILLLADSRFDEAAEIFAEALASTQDPLTRAALMDNLGYCETVRGNHKLGFALLFSGLRILIQLRTDAQQAPLRLALCYAYLEIGRLRRALSHGLKALEVATQHDDTDSIKYAHYLLGETYSQLGHDDTARDYFCRLQHRFYPDAPGVVDLLMAIDVRQIINLKA